MQLAQISHLVGCFLEKKGPPPRPEAEIPQAENRSTSMGASFHGSNPAFAVEAFIYINIGKFNGAPPLLAVVGFGSTI